MGNLNVLTTSLDKFPLKWRWTEKEYCILPKDELAQITPLESSSAKKVWDKTLTFIDKKSDFSANPEMFTVIDTINSTDIEKSSNWLKETIPNSKVIVSWQPGTAVLTSTEIFIKYWDEFCYPASDDVTIYPEDESWVLHYWHEEAFCFARKIV